MEVAKCNPSSRKHSADSMECWASRGRQVIFQALGISLGEHSEMAAQSKDRKRIYVAEAAENEKQKKIRLAGRKRKAKEEDDKKKKEGETYESAYIATSDPDSSEFQRLITWLRNTMTQRSLNHVAVL